jgi:hypothetical protein
MKLVAGGGLLGSFLLLSASFLSQVQEWCEVVESGLTDGERAIVTTGAPASAELNIKPSGSWTDDYPGAHGKCRF